MTRRRGTVEVIGMPFLDMISCAFGGVVVLYLITPPDDQTVEPFTVTRIVELRTAGAAPFALGARFPADSPAEGCFEADCPPDPGRVREWSRGQGRLTAVLADAATPPDSIEIALLGGEGFFTTDCVLVRAEVAGEQRTVKLTHDTGFRKRIEPFDVSGAAAETCP